LQEEAKQYQIHQSFKRAGTLVSSALAKFSSSLQWKPTDTRSKYHCALAQSKQVQLSSLNFWDPFEQVLCSPSWLMLLQAEAAFEEVHQSEISDITPTTIYFNWAQLHYQYASRLKSKFEVEFL
jgi:hypothetical protein